MTSNLAIDYGSGISDAWRSIATFVPKLVAFVVVLVIGWIVAKILARLVKAVLTKVGFDRLTERSGLNGVLAKGNYDAPGLLAKVVYYAILLIALQLAIGVFGPNPISDLLSRFVAWLPKLFVAILIVVIVAAIAKAVKDLIRGALGGTSYGPLLGTLASLFIWGAGIIAALNQIGVATAVTTPVLVAVLATIGGVIVVGVGGGLVRPMQDRWDGWLSKAEDEISTRRAERTEAIDVDSRHGAHSADSPLTSAFQQPRPPQGGPQGPQGGPAPQQGYPAQQRPAGPPQGGTGPSGPGLPPQTPPGPPQPPTTGFDRPQHPGQGYAQDWQGPQGPHLR
ncbi:hypothetical protein P0W64_01005 [Tsukamurella sp. 8F]|uniref:mechanosensitive ion channel family protein n=1 Tax=unclassified Tsukamurella TaxID=2633480 RepID=UPI0023B88692|nr:MULTISPECIES: hypothetical protein [unclassified Tsukamurella]MDF0529164.1 hypothetical protein [Tsukamurella sp. 8J]MDF0585349.1 hypothetical protein [Tsukamurella sp. 8F]